MALSIFPKNLEIISGNRIIKKIVVKIAALFLKLPRYMEYNTVKGSLYPITLSNYE